MAILEVLQRPRAIEVLRSNQLLSELPSTDLNALTELSRVTRAQRGEVLWLNGAQVDFVAIPADGWVKMVRGCASGSDLTIELFGPGQIFGLMGMITGTGCPLTARAVTDLWYVRIPKSKLAEIYASSVPLKDKLLRKAGMRLHGAIDLMARMASGNVEERISAILLIVAESYGVTEGTRVRIQVPLTRQEISEMAGTTVESTIRVMSRWQKDGIITSDRQQIVLLDLKHLSSPQLREV